MIVESRVKLKNPTITDIRQVAEMSTQKSTQKNTKFIENPEIPKYILNNLNNKVGELKVTDYNTWLLSGVSVYKTKKGYAVLTWYQFYCNKYGVIQKCIDYKYASFRVKISELYDILKLHIMKFFNVNEQETEQETAKQIVEKLEEFVSAIVNEKPFSYMIGEYFGCTLSSCYKHYWLYTTF